MDTAVLVVLGALRSGIMFYDTSYVSKANSAYLWSITIRDADSVFYFRYSSDVLVENASGSKAYGISVRTLYLPTRIYAT